MNQSRFQWSSSRGTRFVAVGLAFLAGIITLLYQLLILRVAMIGFGAEAATLAAVVCMSLLGLSGGAYASGMIEQKVRNPIRLLAVLLSFCAVLIFGVAQMQEQLASIVNVTGFALPLRRLLIAAILSLPINILLGTTLPLLTTAVTRDNQAQSFAAIYCAETLGAALGSLLAGFWLIPVLGLTNSLSLAAALSLGSALIAFASGRDADLLDSERLETDRSIEQTVPWLFLFAVLLAGISSIGIEVIWQRLFVLLFGSDTQSFALVAAIYLIGISCGSLIISLIRGRIRGLDSYISVIAWAAATSVMATIALAKLSLDPTFFSFSGSKLMANPIGYRIITAAAILIVPATLIGMALPLAVAYWDERTKRSGSSVGQVYAAALIGNVVGLLGTGFLVSTGNGLRSAVLMLTCVAIVAAVVLAVFIRTAEKNNWLFRFLSVFAVLVWIAASVGLTSANLPLGVNLDDWNLDYYREGKNNIVAVLSRKTDSQKRRMIIDGVNIGESGGGVDEKQQMLAHLPFLVRNGVDSRRVVTIGLGTGILAGALAQHSDVKTVTCVELSREVIEACQQFANINADVMHHDKVVIENSDGIRYLKNLNDFVDVIVSDAKSRPGHAGNVAFFSRDYYQLCQSKLTGEGIFVQWVSLETAPISVQTILSSFHESFPLGYIAIAPPDSIYLVGSNEELDFSATVINEYLAKRPELQRYGWNTADDIGSLFLADQRFLAFHPLASTVNSFDQPILELFAMQSAGNSPVTNKLANLKYFLAMLNENVESGTSSGRQPQRAATIEMLESARLVFDRPNDWLDRAGEHAKAARALLPNLTRHRFVADLYRQLADKAKSSSNESMRFSALLNVNEMGLATAAEQMYLGSVLRDRGQSSQALQHFYSASKQAPDKVEYQLAFGYSLLDTDKFGQALQSFSEIVKKWPKNPQGLLGLGVSQIKLGQLEVGNENIRRALRMNPELQTLYLKYR